VSAKSIFWMWITTVVLIFVSMEITIIVRVGMSYFPTSDYLYAFIVNRIIRFVSVAFVSAIVFLVGSEVRKK
jgi:hypothetical protein